jgi:hypothetical protein
VTELFQEGGAAIERSGAAHSCCVVVVTDVWKMKIFIIIVCKKENRKP